MKIDSEIYRDCLAVTMIRKGRIYTAFRHCEEVAVIAQGPQSLESGVMLLVREICQEIHEKRIE